MSKTEYPEILSDLAQRVTEQLVKTGMDVQNATVVGRQAAEDIRQHWGGQLVYIPQGMSYERRQEYEEIWTAFTGDNHGELARRFKKSVSQIYRIVEIMRAEEMRKHQTDLFAQPTQSGALSQRA